MKKIILLLGAILMFFPALVTSQSNDASSAQIEIKVLTDKQVYSPGEIVGMKLEAKNVGSTPVQLMFPTSQRFDFVVIYNGREVWRWSADKAFLQVIGYEYLKPGQSLEYKVAEYKAEKPAGVYNLIGILTSRPAYKGETTFKVE